MADWRTREWEVSGRTDPYFGVLAEPRFRTRALNEGSRSAFFASGDEEMRGTLSIVRALAGPSVGIGRALDFGCGVGRLTIPLCRAVPHVVGIDASAAMLEEARRNCAHRGITNAEFVESATGVDGVTGEFDFIHSYIVFQHIPPSAGYRIVDGLLSRLAPRGVGMLHFAVARNTSLPRRLVQKARRSSRIVHRLLNVVQRRPVEAPLLAMFEYDLTHLLQLLHAHRFDRIDGRLTDHAGHLGIMLFFSR